MSIVSVDNIQPIGSGTTVTVNSAATLVLNNANSTGVVTATSFVGNLTGTASGNAVLSGSTNNTLVTVTGANAITGEANLKFDGTNLDIDSDSGHLRIGDDQDLDLYHNGSNGYLKNSTGQQLYRSGTHTFENAAGSTEYLRISSDGHLGINTDFTGSQLWRAGKRLEIFGGSGNVTGELHLGANRGDGTQSVGSINFFDNTQDTSHKHVAVIEVDKAGSTSNKRGGDLIFYTKNDNVASPTEKFRINSSGIVTKPYTPMFIAGRTGGNQTFTIGTFPFNVARVNVGSHYNTSTYKFTAPVAGVYYFFAQIYYNNGNGNYRVGFRKEPSGGSALMLNTAAHAMVGNDNTQCLSIIESLAVGDTVRLFSDQNASIQCYYNINDNTYGAHTYFMGYLIG